MPGRQRCQHLGLTLRQSQVRPGQTSPALIRAADKATRPVSAGSIPLPRHRAVQVRDQFGSVEDLHLGIEVRKHCGQPVQDHLVVVPGRAEPARRRCPDAGDSG